MGARINYVFKDSLTKPSVVLYSHWGETEWQRDSNGPAAFKA